MQGLSYNTVRQFRAIIIYKFYLTKTSDILFTTYLYVCILRSSIPISKYSIVNASRYLIKFKKASINSREIFCIQIIIWIDLRAYVKIFTSNVYLIFAFRLKIAISKSFDCYLRSSKLQLQVYIDREVK